MTVRELMRAFRELLADISDTTPPPADSGCLYNWEYDSTGLIWSNDELLRYLNDACVELAKRVPIRDSGRSPATRLLLSRSTARYPLHPSILAVDAVTLESDGLVLRKLSEADAYNSRIDGVTQYNDPDGVWYYREDFDERVLTLYTAPDRHDTLLLAVRRLPLEPLDWSMRSCQEPEFPEHMQLTLLQWAASLAYRKRDADTFNVDLAGFHQGQFTSAVGPQIDFRAERVRKDVAGRRVRTRAYYY